jgi:hypothetical protein
MSWRGTQLGDQLCDQDQLILQLFDGQTVNYVGTDSQFQQNLTHQATADNLVLILNKPIWISDIVNNCQTYLTKHVNTFYIGINRYQLLGNDTSRKINNTGHHGSDLIEFIKEIVFQQGFAVSKSGYYDCDRGQYFNFVQPLTWIYGYKITD